MPPFSTGPRSVLATLIARVTASSSFASTGRNPTVVKLQRRVVALPFHVASTLTS